jgi:GTP:adenosylcobinamide-phosphate guanylyltransferase
MRWLLHSQKKKNAKMSPSASLGRHFILVVHQYHLSCDNILGIIDAVDQTSEPIQALCLQHQHEIVLAKNSAYVQDAFFAP